MFVNGDPSISELTGKEGKVRAVRESHEELLHLRVLNYIINGFRYYVLTYYCRWSG